MANITSIIESIQETMGRGIDSSDLFHEAMEIPGGVEPLRILAMGPTLNWQWETNDVA